MMVSQLRVKNGRGEWLAGGGFGNSVYAETKTEPALAICGQHFYVMWLVTFDGTLYFTRRPSGYLHEDKIVYPNTWMSRIADPSVSISALSIPGTHDSATGELVLGTDDVEIDEGITFFRGI